MDKKNKLEAILILLVAVLIISRALKPGQKQQQGLIEEIKQLEQKPTLPSAVSLPQIEDFEQDEQAILEEEQEEATEEVRLKDLSLETETAKRLAWEEEQALKEAEEEGQDVLSTEPSLKELKTLQRKGLIIF